MTCRHCGRPKVNRPRGLCWGCFENREVRNLYGPLNAYGRRGIGYTGERLPTPTTARPRTPEKLAVLVQRAERNEALFHPADATH